jgi:hypothetical protein
MADSIATAIRHASLQEPFADFLFYCCGHIALIGPVPSGLGWPSYTKYIVRPKNIERPRMEGKLPGPAKSLKAVSAVEVIRLSALPIVYATLKAGVLWPLLASPSEMVVGVVGQ